jgi:exodeoxyribonuclease V alpha subunit
VGDKVMQVRNDYDKDVYNGDVGRIVAIQLEDQRCTIAFSGPAKSNDVEYAGPDLDELVHAYAVSVHKAQGSEFPCVVMPLVTGHYVLLQRNLLYTAITRARQLCVLVGSPRALSLAVNTYHGDRRYTALAERLKTPVEDMLQLELA